jgi:hypothetical protein
LKQWNECFNRPDGSSMPRPKDSDNTHAGSQPCRLHTPTLQPHAGRKSQCVEAPLTSSDMISPWFFQRPLQLESANGRQDRERGDQGGQDIVIWSRLHLDGLDGACSWQYDGWSEI